MEFPFDPYNPASAERFFAGVEWCVNAAWDYAPHVVRCFAAIKTGMESYKYVKSLLPEPSKPNGEWENKHGVVLSPGIPKLPSEILEEILELTSVTSAAALAMTRAAGNGQYYLDNHFIDIGSLNDQQQTLIKVRHLIEIARVGDFKCCKCGENVGLSSLCYRKEIAIALRTHRDKSAIRLHCDDCRNQWANILKETVPLFDNNGQKWTSSPLFTSHKSLDKRFNAVDKVLEDAENQLPAFFRLFKRADVEFLLKNYPTVLTHAKRKLDQLTPTKSQSSTAEAPPHEIRQILNGEHHNDVANPESDHIQEVVESPAKRVALGPARSDVRGESNCPLTYQK